MRQSFPQPRLLHLTLVLIAFGLMPAQAFADKIEPWHEIHGVGAKEYQAWLDRVHKEGYQPVDVSVLSTGGAPQFSAIAIKGPAHPLGGAIRHPRRQLRQGWRGTHQEGLSPDQLRGLSRAERHPFRDPLGQGR